MSRVDELKTDGAEKGNERGAESQRVSFLPEQQARVQELIDEAYKKAYAKAARFGAPGDEFERLKTEVDQLRKEKKNSILIRSIARHNVVDAGEVAELVKERVRIDDAGNVSIAGESGATLINSGGEPVSVDEFISRWLTERPHHLRSHSMAGAGSQASRLYASSSVKYDLNDPAAWRNMPREDLDRLLGEGVTVRGAAGQTYSFRDVKNPFTEARKKRTNSGG